MAPAEQAVSETAIMAACTRHKQEHWRDIDYRACVSIGSDYFVKFGHYEAIWPQIATQSYISTYAESQPDAPRIPRVIHHFQGDRKETYFVMEYIKLMGSPPDLDERRAEPSNGFRGFQLLPTT